MSENKLIGSLVLRTIDIEPTNRSPCPTTNSTTDNDYGFCTANSQLITWKNVNIRNCLGGLYQKYDSFNLKLTAVQFRHNNVASTDFQFMIYMAGLPFSTNYNTKLGSNNQAALGVVSYMPFLTQGITTPLISNLVSFYKPLQDTLDITVELKNSSTNPLVNGYSEKTDRTIGHWSIICDIYGIDK